MKNCGVPLARIGSSLPQSSRKRLCQLPAGNPVAALTVHRTVIHYRDDASLTLVRGSHWGDIFRVAEFDIRLRRSICPALRDAICAAAREGFVAASGDRDTAYGCGGEELFVDRKWAGGVK